MRVQKIRVDGVPFEVAGDEVRYVGTGEGFVMTEGCRRKVLSKLRARANRAARDDAMRACGLVKVRGAVSGRTYWE